MKILINTQDVNKALIRYEKELSKALFGREKYPLGFITGVQNSMNIANIAYHATGDIESAIKELQERVENMDITIIKCSYWFTLSYLHYMNDDTILSTLASACLKVCYKEAVTDNDWYNFLM